MASHLKGLKKSTIIDEMHKTFCEYNIENPTYIQKQLQQWVLETFN